MKRLRDFALYRDRAAVVLEKEDGLSFALGCDKPGIVEMVESYLGIDRLLRKHAIPEQLNALLGLLEATTLKSETVLGFVVGEDTFIAIPQRLRKLGSWTMIELDKPSEGWQYISDCTVQLDKLSPVARKKIQEDSLKCVNTNTVNSYLKILNRLGRRGGYGSGGLHREEVEKHLLTTGQILQLWPGAANYLATKRKPARRSRFPVPDFSNLALGQYASGAITILAGDSTIMSNLSGPEMATAFGSGAVVWTGDLAEASKLADAAHATQVVLGAFPKDLGLGQG